MVGQIYGALLRNVLIPGWESRLRRRPTLDRLVWLERMQWRPAEELEALQLGALRRLLKHAHKNVPWYRERMGVRPEEIKDLRDLSRLPILSKLDARQSGARRACRRCRRCRRFKKATSGTMGQPLTFGYEPDSEYWRQATKLRGYGWAGYRIGAASLHYWGAWRDGAGLHAATQ